jgi:alpha-galactosidase
LLLLAAAVAPLGAGADVEVEDAFVRESADGRRWEVGNRAVRYDLGLDASGSLGVYALAPSGRDSLIAPGGADADLIIDDVRVPVGGRDFRFLAAEANAVDGRAVLTLAFAHRDRPMTVGRHYAVAPGAAVIEMWTTVDVEAPTRLRDLDGLRLEVLARDAWWHRGHDTPDADGGPFTRQTATLDDGREIRFGSQALSSLEALPWFGLDAGPDRVLIGLAWSGSWRTVLVGTAAGTYVHAGLPDMAVTARPGVTVEYPHAFIAVTGARPGDQAAAVAAWLAARRHGRTFPALATYNTWFTFGIGIDEALIRREMESFAAIGGELFQLDAGWYPAEQPAHVYDFSAGLGSWRVDPRRFPDGLGALSDYAHGLGLRFGVWVEPERIDRVTIGRPGLAEDRFLARQDGAYQPGRPNDGPGQAQICLGHGAAWQWLHDRLVAFLDEARPDYLKVDLNGWVVCNRDDHDHDRDGGNFAHVTGLYRLLDALRQRYPSLLVENVSGGARRLDAEMLTRADAHWMDDRTAPAARVRHHLELLTTVVPPGALLSYLLPHADEPMMESDDLPLLSRSRMLGVLGLSVDFRGMSEGDHHRLAAQFDQYKGLRALRGHALTALLGDPVGIGGDGPGWDVVEQVDPASGVAVIFAFRNPHGERRVRVEPTQLIAGRTYRLRSLDRGELGSAVADDLMTSGLVIETSSRSSSEVVVLEPR